jgi:hypothetical protein
LIIGISWGQIGNSSLIVEKGVLISPKNIPNNLFPESVKNITLKNEKKGKSVKITH